MDEVDKKKFKGWLEKIHWRRENDKETGKVRVVWDVPMDMSNKL